jgi:catechol-2,3-dioxygenase
MYLTELRLAAHDLPAQREFYANTLGLPVLSSTPDGLRLDARRTRLTFEHSEQPHRYHFALNIPENQFAEARAWIAARVALVRDSSGKDEFPFPHWNAHALYFRDPVGNIVEFIARHGLPNASDEPFGPRSLLSVSEIGLAVPNVPEAVRWLGETFGLPVYDGAGSQEFTAVGDEDGLFIVVRLGRVWFPETGVPALLSPVTATLAGEPTDKAQLPGTPYLIQRSSPP